MSEIQIVRGDDDAVREPARRRNLDDLALRATLRLARDGDAWIARDGFETVGYALAHASEVERCVADFYVEPSYRNRGIAGGLLQAAFDDAVETSRAMLFDAGDAASLWLALQQRLTPSEPLATLAGPVPSEDALLQLAAGASFDVEPVDAQKHAGLLAELDRATRGVDRGRIAAASDAAGIAFWLQGECIGYAFVASDGGVGPLAAASPTYVPAIFAYALVSLRRRLGVTWCRAVVPGAAARLLRALVRAGLRIERTLLFASDSAPPQLDRYVAAHRLTF